MVKNRKAWSAAVRGVTKSQTRLSNWTTVDAIFMTTDLPTFGPHSWCLVNTQKSDPTGSIPGHVSNTEKAISGWVPHWPGIPGCSLSSSLPWSSIRGLFQLLTTSPECWQADLFIHFFINGTCWVLPRHRGDSPDVEAELAALAAPPLPRPTDEQWSTRHRHGTSSGSLCPDLLLRTLAYNVTAEPRQKMAFLQLSRESLCQMMEFFSHSTHVWEWPRKCLEYWFGGYK